MTDFQELEFRMCTLEDANKLVEHFNRSLVHLWRDEDRIVGEVNLRTKVLKMNPHRASLGIELEKAYRGQGIGRLLMDKIIEWGRCADRFRVAGKNITDISMSLKLSP
tara:strand:+ start:133 stop:456 length:324 start_codon:yes stop_codon:yes gene_type:complete